MYKIIIPIFEYIKQINEYCMRTKLYKNLAVVLIALIGFSAFTACGDDITEEYITYKKGADVISYDFTVKKEHWGWNENRARYECLIAFDELAEDVFSDGAVLGYVYVQEGNILIQNILPYVASYPVDDIVSPYMTETYGFDISLDPKEILFYIQASDLVRRDDDLKTTKFKVSLVWRLK